MTGLNELTREEVEKLLSMVVARSQQLENTRPYLVEVADEAFLLSQLEPKLRRAYQS